MGFMKEKEEEGLVVSVVLRWGEGRRKSRKSIKPRPIANATPGNSRRPSYPLTRTPSSPSAPTPPARFSTLNTASPTTRYFT